MKKKIIITFSFILALLSGLIILYNKTPHYNMEIDGVKLAVTLDGNEVSSFPKNNDYYVDINCQNVIGEYLYDEQEQTFKLTFKNIESGAKCSLSFTSNPDTLKTMVELLDEGGSVGFDYSSLPYSKYNMTTPFYTSSWSSTVTSGTEEAGAISWDSTNNYWITNPTNNNQHYYYIINVTETGYYKICVKYISGSSTNKIYLYKNTKNMYNGTSYSVFSYSDVCFSYGTTGPSDTIRLDQYTIDSVASLGIYLEKANSAIDIGYRYKGLNPNNYLWFNNEMWRIIGSVPTKIDNGASTTKTNLVKIIRSDPIGMLVWNTTTPRPSWNESTLYTLLNTYYFGAQNATGSQYCYGYQSSAKAKCDYRYIGINPSGYYGEMVKEVYWKTGAIRDSQVDMTYDDEASEEIIKARIGLINGTDYSYASSNVNYLTSMNTYTVATADWIYGKGYEWTISRRTDQNNASNISVIGHIDSNSVDRGNVVRPVVYLDSSVYVVSGDGSQATPYKIAWPSGS